MTARTLTLTAAMIASTFAIAAAPAHAGLLQDFNALLGDTTDPLLDDSQQLVGELDPTEGTVTSLTGEVIGVVDSTSGQLYSTTGELLGTVDSSTGLLVDPLGNVIGAVIPAGGTGGSGGGGGASPGAPGTPAGGGGTAFGTASFSMALSAGRTQRLATVARRGVNASTRCSATCGILAAAAIDGRTARRLGLTRGTRPVVVGTAVAGPGRVAIQLSSRARRALSRSLPTSRIRKSVRSKRLRAFRTARSRSVPASKRRSARRAYNRYRRVERRWISSGRVKVMVAAVGMDSRGRTTTISRRSLVVKR